MDSDHSGPLYSSRASAGRTPGFAACLSGNGKECTPSVRGVARQVYGQESLVACTRLWPGLKGGGLFLVTCVASQRCVERPK